jgi:HD-like signal output (HDOD) protein
VPIENKLNNIVKSFANISEQAAKAKDILSSDPVNVELLASVLELDVALSSKILQIANSPFFGLSREILSVKDALVVIGLLSANNTIAMAAVTNQLNKGKNTAPLDPKQLWLRSLVVACACKYFANNFKVDPQKAFMLGMFHLIGRMGLNNCIAEYVDVVELSKTKNISMQEAELEKLEFDHKQLGVQLVRKWHLPQIIEQAISDKANTEEPTCYYDLLHLAKYIGQKMAIGDNYAFELMVFNDDILDQYQINHEDFLASFNEIEKIKSESMELIN